MNNLLPLLVAQFVLLAHAGPDYAAAGQQYAQCSALVLDLNDLTFCNSTWRTEIPHLFLKQQLGSEGWWNWVDRQRYLEPDYILNQTVYNSLMWTWHNLGLREVLLDDSLELSGKTLDNNQYTVMTTDSLHIQLPRPSYSYEWVADDTLFAAYRLTAEEYQSIEAKLSARTSATRTDLGKCLAAAIAHLSDNGSEAHLAVVMKLGQLEITDGWMDGQQEVYKSTTRPDVNIPQSLSRYLPGGELAYTDIITYDPACLKQAPYMLEASVKLQLVIEEKVYAGPASRRQQLLDALHRKAASRTPDQLALPRCWFAAEGVRTLPAIPSRWGLVRSS
eukprot:jgi/Astpho2/4842/fgenesh1_pg.00069_%23_2_t